MVTDSIGDYLTRIRNAIAANHRIVPIPASNLKKAITKILLEKGYILNYKFIDDKTQGTIKIALKYHPQTKMPAIRMIRRVSRPGLRQYRSADKLPRVLNGMGIAVLSTNRGILSDKEAKQMKIGGEVLFYIY
ncbi:MAG: 30S ribosomal protein S8 [Bacteroidetes bacterium]|nr:30S ribosomal protein S8 [Bacteroidota bacterium]